MRPFELPSLSSSAIAWRTSPPMCAAGQNSGPAAALWLPTGSDAVPSDDIREEQHFWSAIALLVYALLLAACLALVAEAGDIALANLGFFDLAVMGLAAFRLVHLITFDKIFEMVRTAFMDRHGASLKNAERGWRRLMCEFMQCIWCTGMWSGLIVVVAYCLGPWLRLAVLVLAVAGLGSLLQVVSKALARQRA
jgi:hypothetical protein